MSTCHKDYIMILSYDLKTQLESSLLTLISLAVFISVFVYIRMNVVSVLASRDMVSYCVVCV